MRGATQTGSPAPCPHIFQSTRPVRGATIESAGNCIIFFDISIHAPRAGRDHGQDTQGRLFQPRFQSTRPVRGATIFLLLGLGAEVISIHAPRAGRDLAQLLDAAPVAVFQATRPVRGATAYIRSFELPPDISIHAPRAGRDRAWWRCWWSRYISIHAPRAGRDLIPRPLSKATPYFNPRAPCGARQQKYTKLLYTLLRQKAILRQFHAKRRLLKRFSTYKYRNTFLICSANRMGKICTLPLRTTRSLDLPEGMSACSQSARFCFRTFFPSSKTADYPAPDP